MTINTTLVGLSQNPTLNGPDGASDLPSQYDNAIRYALSFTAQLRDGAGFTAGAIVAGLGYTPVIRGGITGTDTNAVNIGYHTALGKMVVASNGNNFSNQWPIDITGNAATATNATNATNATTAAACSGNAATASNASAIAGISGWVYSNLSNNATYVWVTNNVGQQFLAQMGAMAVGSATTAGSCTGNSATASLANDSNNLGGVGAGGWVRNVGSVVSLNNSGFAQIIANIGGTSCFWGMSVSDARLKKNIAPSVEDSLAKISRIEFKQFNFGALPSGLAIDDGHLHKAGFLAQDLEAIDGEWIVEPEGGYKQPDTAALLAAALHAIKQLSAKVSALEARLAA